MADRLADRILAGGSVEHVAERILEGPELGRVATQLVESPGAERLVAQVLDSPGVDRLFARTLDSPRVERLVGDALESPGLERLITRIVESPAMERTVGQVIESRLLDQVASQDASARAIAEAPARAAAAGRVRVHAGTAEPAAADYTGLVTRAIGFGIDAVIIDLAAILVVAIVALALTLFKVPSRIDTALAALAAAVFIVWGAAYFVAFWSTTGQTPGARIMRFRVPAPGAKRGHLSPRRALLRVLAMILAAIPLLAGYFMVLFDDRRRGLHDRLARTVVVDAPDTETPVRRRRARSRT